MRITQFLRFLLGGVALLVTGMALIIPQACNTPTVDSETTLVIGVLADIQNWNPYLTETKFSEDLLALVYPSLVIEMPDYHDHPPTFAPAVASSWEFSNDGLELIFHLRRDLVWSDGETLNADDVVFTWKAQVSEEVGWYGAYTKDFISAVEKIDDFTLRFRFSQAYPLALMDSNEGPILPAHAWKEIPFSDWRSTPWLEHVVGAGPFLPRGHTPQQEIILGANPGYRLGSVAHIDRVVWRIVPDQLSLMTQLLAGDFDFVNSLPPEDAQRVQANPDLKLVDIPHRGYTHICWNTTRPQLSDARVRRALGMAIDRKTIIDTVYRGYAQPSIGPILSTMWAFDSSLKPLPFDPRGAADLLAEAGWHDTDGDGTLDKDGHAFELELLTNAENHMRQDICMLVARDLRSVGIDATPRTVEWGTFLSRLRNGDFDGAVNRWVEPTQIDLEDVWHTTPKGEESSNYGRYSNDEVDRLIEEVADTEEIAQQRKLYSRIQQLIVTDQPYTFLVEGRKLRAISTRISGSIQNDATPYFNLEEWELH
jgi:peptide/nickel transport system substrate-binding protein